MKFWDASALIPLCLQERESPSLKKLVQADQSIVAWWASPIECLSALARLRREEALGLEEEGQAQAVLRALMAGWTEVEPSEAVRDQAAIAFCDCIPYEPQTRCNWRPRWCGVKVIHRTESLCVSTNDCATPAAVKGSSSCRRFDALTRGCIKIQTNPLIQTVLGAVC